MWVGFTESFELKRLASLGFRLLGFFFFLTVVRDSVIAR